MAKYLHHDTKAAREALRKLTAGAFRRDGETAPVCFSIPARCDDADLLLDDVIEERDALAADLARLRDLAHGPETPAETLDRLAKAAAELKTAGDLYRGAVVELQKAAAEVRRLTGDLARLRAIEAAAGRAAAGVRHSLACERAPGTGCLCGLGALRAAVAGKGGA
jgi:hypothetical protein